MGLTAAKRPGFVGSRFGKLAILQKHGLTEDKHLLVDCQCDCGNQTTVRWNCLRSGNTTSCGCICRSRAKDITDRIFGRVLVVERFGSDFKSKALWKCLCECGIEFVSNGSGLRSGRIRSCGCLNKEVRAETGRKYIRGAIEACKKPSGEAACKELISQYRRNACNREREWLVPDEDAIKLFTSNCEYCGRAPHQLTGKTSNHGKFIYNGIDRVDSTKGYTLDNIVPCCKWCNWIKGKHSVAQFYENVARIANHHPEILGTVEG